MINTAKPTTTTDSSMSIAEPLWFSLVSTRGAADKKKNRQVSVYEVEKKHQLHFHLHESLRYRSTGSPTPKSRFTNLYESLFTELRFLGCFIFCTI